MRLSSLLSVIDGSGVLHDPNGIERVELTRLAKERKMINNFDASKLSKDGYRVLVEDQDFKLPCKTSIEREGSVQLLMRHP